MGGPTPSPNMIPQNVAPAGNLLALIQAQGQRSQLQQLLGLLGGGQRPGAPLGGNQYPGAAQFYPAPANFVPHGGGMQPHVPVDVSHGFKRPLQPGVGGPVVHLPEHPVAGLHGQQPRMSNLNVLQQLARARAVAQTVQHLRRLRPSQGDVPPVVHPHGVSEY